MTTTLICLMLHWWLKEIPKECTNIHLPKVDFVIHPDPVRLTGEQLMGK